jgi:hypothetical protein
MSSQSVSLKTLLVPSKAVSVEYPGMPGFIIDISYLSRETTIAIRKKATKVTFKNRQATEELNDELFLELYVKATVKGWKGLTFAYLEQLAPVDLGAQNLTDELEFSDENALMLMKASVGFDSFISEQVVDLGNFSKSSSTK